MCSVKMRGDRFFAFVKYERGNQGEPRRCVVRAIGRLAMVRNMGVASTREPTLPSGNGRRVIGSTSSSRLSLSININFVFLTTCSLSNSVQFCTIPNCTYCNV